VSISSTFYARLFCTKVLRTAFLKLRLGFGVSTKALLYEKLAHKTLMKLTNGLIIRTDTIVNILSNTEEGGGSS